jgi:hypothetical protein
MDKKVILGRKKPKSKRRGLRVAGLGPIATFARSGREDYCSKPLTAQSQARAEKAEQDGSLSMLEGELFCECGERVGARHRPWMDGPMGGPLVPTLHYPQKFLRKLVNPSGKPGYYKR